MRELTLGGIHDDSDHLILLDSEGERYTVRIDEALRAAVRRDRPSVALLQQGHETSALRPKEIQALLRGGASVESIAQMSDISEDRIRRFEGPILAERSHMAQRAQSFRPSRGSERTLLSIVQERLAARNVEQEPEWDAWRRPDGSWTLQLMFVAGSRTRTATWHLDVPARVARAEDDEARWLSDADEDTEEHQRPRLASVRARVFNVEEPEEESSATGAQPAEASESTQSSEPISEAQLDELNARRGVPTASPWQSLDDAASSPAQQHVHHPSATGETDRGPKARNYFMTTEEVEYVEAPEDLNDAIDREVQDPAHDPHASAPEDDGKADDGADGDTAEAASDSAGHEQVDDDTADADADTDADADDDPSLTPLPGFTAEAKKPAKKAKKGRASIPSWDDIVFGSRDK